MASKLQNDDILQIARELNEFSFKLSESYTQAQSRGDVPLENAVVTTIEGIYIFMQYAETLGIELAEDINDPLPERTEFIEHIREMAVMPGAITKAAQGIYNSMNEIFDGIGINNDDDIRNIEDIVSNIAQSLAYNLSQLNSQAYRDWNTASREVLQDMALLITLRDAYQALNERFNIDFVSEFESLLEEYEVRLGEDETAPLMEYITMESMREVFNTVVQTDVYQSGIRAKLTSSRSGVTKPRTKNPFEWMLYGADRAKRRVAPAIDRAYQKMSPIFYLNARIGEIESAGGETNPLKPYISGKGGLIAYLRGGAAKVVEETPHEEPEPQEEEALHQHVEEHEGEHNDQNANLSDKLDLSAGPTRDLPAPTVDEVFKDLYDPAGRNVNILARLIYDQNRDGTNELYDNIIIRLLGEDGTPAYDAPYWQIEDGFQQERSYLLLRKFAFDADGSVANIYRVLQQRPPEQLDGFYRTLIDETNLEALYESTKEAFGQVMEDEKLVRSFAEMLHINYEVAAWFHRATAEQLGQKENAEPCEQTRHNVFEVYKTYLAPQTVKAK